MKLNVTTVLGILTSLWLTVPTNTSWAQSTPTQTPLIPSPRQSFTPTPQTTRGYWNIDVVGDFTLPKTKSITFCGAGRNLHASQDWQKLFRRGFSSIERSRMTPDEIGLDRRERIGSQSKSDKADTWKSRLLPEQRALILYQNYFTEPPFSLPWARDSELASKTFFLHPPGSPTPRQSMGFAMSELSGGCVAFNDCPSSGQINTFGKIYFDIENEGTTFSNRQEHANLYAYKMWAIRKVLSPYTEIGGIGPVPHNSYGYSRSSDFANVSSPDWLWSTTAQQIGATNTRGRGMPDDIVGKSFGDLTDFQMPGTYFLSSDLDYSAPHNGDEDRHWLASLLGEQEVNMKLSPKKRIAWQWLFNTQSTNPNEASRAEIPVQPVIAEGLGIFYWFTGAYGTVFWDDWNELTPNAPVVPGRENLDNNRHYACYEHYIHGLWRLFKHHGDLFNGQEKYLNEETECSYDGGKSWYRLNSNALKRSGYAFARTIVNGDQILVAATQAYGSPNQQSSLMVRYVQDGYRFYTTINLKGDEIYLGRGTMPKGSSEVTPSQTSLPIGGGGDTSNPLAATVASYNCSTGAIMFGTTNATSGTVEYSAIGVTGWTTHQAFMLDAGLRLDLKPITVQVRQNGREGTPFVFDLKAHCSDSSKPPVNTVPIVANVINPQVAVVGTAYSLNIGGVFTDTQTPTALSLSAEGLPAGLSLNGTVITGTPSVAGVSTVTLKATDPGGLSTSASFVLTVTNVPVTLPTTGTLTARVVSYNCTTGNITFGSTGGNNTTVEYSAIGITGWTSNQNFTLEAGLRTDLKPITINVRQNGVPGISFVFDLRTYCANPIQPPVNTAPTVASAVNSQTVLTGTAYSLNVGSVFTDSQTPTALSLSAEGLPAGLSLNGTVITGTPSVAGVSTVTLKATDPGSLSNTTTFVLTVNSTPVTLPTTGTLTARVVSYNCTTGNITFGSTRGNNTIVEYMALGVTGWTTNQNFTLDTGLRTDLKPITINVRQNGVPGISFVFDLRTYCANPIQPPVNTAPTVASGVSPQSAQVGTAYNLNMGTIFTDTQTPTTLVLSADGLPAGLSLNGTVITGTPSVAGVSTITLKATDPGGLSTSASFVLTVTNVPVTPPTTGTLTARVVGYNCTTGNITFGSTGGNNTTVEYMALGVTGWTTNQNFTLDTGLRTDLKPITINVRQNGVPGISFVFDLRTYCANPIQPPVNTAPTVANAVNSQTVLTGTAYSLNIGGVFTDTQTPTALSLSAEGLPAGLSLNGTVITGTPSVAGVSTITLKATDPGGLSNTTTFVLTVNSTPVTLPTTGTLTARVVGYNCTTGNITFGSTGGNKTTVEYMALGVTGWTTNQNFTLEAGLRTDLKPITINVRQNGVPGISFVFDLRTYCANPIQPPVNTAPTVASAVNSQTVLTGTAYSLNVGSVFTDSQTPTALSLSANELPAGLSLNGTVITGTPSVAGVSTITLKATDPGGLSNTTTFVLTVNSTPVTLPTTGTLTARVVGYNCTTGAITFGSTGGNNTTVEYSAIGITGWTTNQNFTLDAGLRTDPKPITINVRQNGVPGISFVFDLRTYCANPIQPPVNTAPTVASAVNSQTVLTGTAYSLNIGSVFTDSQTPTALSLSAEGLPAGLSLNGTVITGTPSVAGVSTITLKATDPGSLSNTTTFVLTVNPPVVTTPPSDPPTTSNCGSPASTIGEELRVAGLSDVNCQTGTFRIIVTGGNGSDINYANLVGLNNADPTNCRRGVDSPGLITAINNPLSDVGNFPIRVTQEGITSNTFSFNFKEYCTTTGARVALETRDDLNVLILGNPVSTEWVEIEVQNAYNEPLTSRITDMQGKAVTQQEAGSSGSVVRQRLWLGKVSGVFLLQVNTPTRGKTIKLVKH